LPELAKARKNQAFFIMGVMKRLKVLFALLLLISALPLWRFMDMLIWIRPNTLLYPIVFFLWALLFLAIPAKLLAPKFHMFLYGLMAIAMGITSHLTGTLSPMASKEPEHSHCGFLTYTGLVYPLHHLLTAAHADDLEVRNQLCWVRKMALWVPEKFDSEVELAQYVNLTHEKLMLPSRKFRATLPLIAYLHGLMFFRWDEGGKSYEAFKSGKWFVEGLNFWIDQYTEEISERSYRWFNFPHGPYIQFEYGLIEKNWEAIVRGIVVE
jgi:hypothetical protein